MFVRIISFSVIFMLSFSLHAKNLKRGHSQGKTGNSASWKHAEARLRKEGFKKSFITAMKENYETTHFAQTVELNLLLFLKKSDYHGVQVNDAAVKDVSRFMRKHRIELDKAERDHGVSASVISSLLWLESRYGKNQGYFHVPSVYAHLLQLDRPDVIKHLHRRAGDFTTKLNKGILDEISKRSQRKILWALEELKAIQTMQSRDNKTVGHLRGSFAGAFGMAQFIPSSFVHWARPYKNGTVPNLSKAADALYSVGYYLKDNGWKRMSEPTHMKALLKYNNSTDYANAILKLAGRVDSLPHRRPAEEQEEQDGDVNDPLNSF
jgi:membrane-bound lytic murein transglycosylase B